MHVVGVEAGLRHRVAHLDLAVHALLAQDRHARALEIEEGCGDIVCRIEAQLHLQSGVVDAARGLVLGTGAHRVVAQAGDAPADLVPDLMQLAQRRAEDGLGVTPDLDHLPIVGLADEVAVPRQPVVAQHLHHVVAH